MIKVYRHRRLDNNMVFYVGIGVKDRPYKKSGRNRHWKNITNKTSYTVEILAECSSWTEAAELEKMLILEYGRKDLNTGILVNMTDGGEGCLGRTLTDEFKENHSNNSPLNKVVYVFTKDGKFINKFNSYTECAKQLSINRTCVSSCMLGYQKSAGGFILSSTNNINPYKGNNKEIYSETLDKYFGSVKECAEYLEHDQSYISKMIKGVKYNKYKLRFL